MSGLVNKIKEAVHSDKKHEQPTGTSGPHDSRAANAADPRVDSDRDHRANPATGTTGTNTYGSSTTGSSGLGGDNFTHSGTGVTGAPGGTGTMGTSGVGSTGSTNAGPHSSNLANKADPRVDSDRDGRAARTTGGVGATTGAGEFGSSRTTGAGAGEFGSTTRSGAEYGSSTMGSSGLNTSSNRGPHDSNLANKADPRVDSDRDHRANPATGTMGSSNTYGSSTTTGTTGAMGSSGLGSSNRGPHDSNLANKADPRVDSDRDHRANPTTGTMGSSNTYGSSTTTGTTGLGASNPGPAPNTAGPHKSDMLNKVDPRVDSDRDGSKTVGQDQTYARS